MFLVTRPQPKAKETSDALVANGFKVISLPAISIEQLQIPPPRLGDGYDVIVVTSSYARAYLNQNLQALCHQNTRFLCVGQGTAAMLKNELKMHTFTCQIDIAEPQNSEGVIASKTFASIDGKTVAIIKGQDGRDAIAQHLLQNKVKTDIYEVYKRQASFRGSDINRVDGESIKCIIVTSIDIAEHVFEYFSFDWLKDRIFMVASQRIYDYVKAKGAQQLVLSSSASTASIVSCANQLHLSGVLDDKR